MKKLASFVLIILALVMFYLSYNIGGLPPAVTGVGFIIIAIVWLKEGR
ncbi:MAG TPA: hypothetical protein ACFCUD_00390 [Cyclobacteriaceae bacterium]